VHFEGGVRLVGFGLDRASLPAGGSTAANFTWRISTRPATPYQLVLQLRSDDQIIWRSDELPLTGLAPYGSWAPDRPVSLSALVRVPRSTKPGEYGLSARIYDPRGRRFLDPSYDGGSDRQRDPKGVTLGTITITASSER
jgi:hypothetical protein